MERNLVRSGEVRQTESQKDGKTVSLKKFQIIQQVVIIIRHSFAAPSSERDVALFGACKTFYATSPFSFMQIVYCIYGRHCWERRYLSRGSEAIASPLLRNDASQGCSLLLSSLRSEITLVYVIASLVVWRSNLLLYYTFAGASIPKDHLLPSVVAPIASEISIAYQPNKTNLLNKGSAIVFQIPRYNLGRINRHQVIHCGGTLAPERFHFHSIKHP